ncbi:MAG TPA: SURF1 family protein [Usitatibacter sp.]|nr:SURF1 family protein [Usitatibacter sp.]
MVTTLAAVAFIALTVSLGRWQVGRGEEKAARQSMFDSRLRDAPLRLTGSVPTADPLLYRRVAARGEWIPERQIYVDNQIRDGRAGFHVVTPLKIEASPAAVLVNRGWIARDARYPEAPPVAVPRGPVEVHGLATRPPARFLELSPQVISGNVWQNLSIERYRERSGLELLPVVVLADPPAEGLAAVRETPDAGIAKHREYALTWFSLAITALVLWIVLNLRRQP